MKMFYAIGLLIILVAAWKGWKKGFVQTLGNVCASILSLGFFWILKNWAFDSYLGTLLFCHSVLLVRLVICVALFLILFFVLKAVIVSLRVVSSLPIIRGLDRLLGLVLGGLFGVVIVGIMTIFYEWIR